MILSNKRKFVIKYINILILSLVSTSWAYSNPFSEKNLPDLIKTAIKEDKELCREVDDANGKEGEYHINSGIRKISILDHDIQYIIYSLEEVDCSASASFFSGSAGYNLQIFSNLDNKWQKIYENVVFKYRLLSHRAPNLPVNLEVYSKGNPGFTINKIEYEWNVKTHSYHIISVEEDYFNDLKKCQD